MTSPLDDAPRFALAELRAMRNALGNSLHYVGPVGLNNEATQVWRDHKHWLDRITSLIDETDEWEREVAR